MAGQEYIDVFEQRLAALESDVFGDFEKDADYPKNAKLKSSCVDSLMDIFNKINASLVGKKKAALIYQKLPELKQYLDHAVTDEMVLSTDAISDSIIAESDFIHKQAALLQKLNDNQVHMNSEHIHGISQQTEKLQSLSKVHITQQDEVAQLTNDIRQLLQTYNSVVSLMSKQFVLWDQTLTDLEKRVKK